MERADNPNSGMSGRKRYDQNGAQWRKLRAQVLRNQDTCCFCGGYVDKTLPKLDPGAPQVDHIIPWSKGGTNTLANLALSHRACNRSASDKRTPGPPTRSKTRTTRAW